MYLQSWGPRLKFMEGQWNFPQHGEFEARIALPGVALENISSKHILSFLFSSVRVSLRFKVRKSLQRCEEWNHITDLSRWKQHRWQGENGTLMHKSNLRVCTRMCSILTEGFPEGSVSAASCEAPRRRLMGCTCYLRMLNVLGSGGDCESGKCKLQNKSFFFWFVSQ